MRGIAVLAGMTINTTAVALYAAALSTVVALWQISWQVYSRWDQQRTKAEALIFDASEDRDEAGGWDLVVVQVINHSAHEISVQNITLKDATDGRFRGFPWVARDDDRKLPVPIPPHQQGDFACLSEHVATRMDTGHPVVARVRLGNNSFRDSRPTKIEAYF